MSAPALPEIFGNYVLGEFVEVVSPDGVSWLPQTAGWYWLGAALAVLALRYAWRRLRRWYRNRYRREAAQRLREISNELSPEQAPLKLNRLLKLTAMAGFSREQVAQLHGEAWVDFLNAQCDTPPFTGELGRCLSAGPYRNTDIDAATSAALLAACEAWVRGHRDPIHV